MSTSWDTSKLIAIGFTHIGEWQLAGDELKLSSPAGVAPKLNATHVLYAFVAGSKVYYIGKTTRALKVRLHEYAVGDPALKTNRKCHDNDRKMLERPDTRVEILTFHKPDALLHWADIKIGLAAGLEDELIHKFRPAWNGSNKHPETETEFVEKAATSTPP